AILVTYGEPEKNSVPIHYDYSKRILKRITQKVAPIPDYAIPVIAAWRAVSRYLSWRKYGYRSPLNEITMRQGESLESHLKEKCPSVQWNVHVALQFMPMFLPEILYGILEAVPDRVLVIPMYVPRSDFTSGLCDEDFEIFREKYGNLPDSVKRLDPIEQRDKLADVMVEFVKHEMVNRGLNSASAKGRALILGAHGTVISPPPGIRDTGFADTDALGKVLLDQLHPYFDSCSIGWLNHRVGGEWTSPSLEAAVLEMRGNGIEEFVYFPFGFLADNEETLLSGRQVFADLNIENVIHLPCLNDDTAFIELLAEAVLSQNTARAAHGSSPL
ncbi:MAG TPA: ferrochelatase, partial [bacterium]|nr:ferrochelatase [bacterium]